MTWRAGARLTAATLVAGSVLFALPATSAPQAWSQMVVSRDGHTWGSTLDGPLFPRHFVWVPGDVQTRKVLVRNRSGGPATITVRIDVGNGAGGAAASGLRASVRSKHTWVRLTGAGFRPVLSVPVAAADVVPVWVRVAMDPRSANESMSDRTPIRVRMTLSPAPAG